MSEIIARYQKGPDDTEIIIACIAGETQAIIDGKLADLYGELYPKSGYDVSKDDITVVINQVGTSIFKNETFLMLCKLGRPIDILAVDILDVVQSVEDFDILEKYKSNITLVTNKYGEPMSTHCVPSALRKLL
jgi:hypothetical protein